MPQNLNPEREEMFRQLHVGRGARSAIAEEVNLSEQASDVHSQRSHQTVRSMIMPGVPQRPRHNIGSDQLMVSPEQQFNNANRREARVFNQIGGMRAVPESQDEESHHTGHDGTE